MRAAFLALALLIPTGEAPAAGLQMRSYGVAATGEEVHQYTLRGTDGIVVRFLSYGGIITDIEVPDRAGRRANVVLGLPSLADYEQKNGLYSFGGIVGRYAGRIAGARFAVDGREARLQANDGPNALHGGAGPSFIAKVWRVEPLPEPGAAGATLHYVSPAGEQGFPGRLALTVTYRLLPGRQLRIDYEARTDAPTVLNLTNHSYFNLAGADAGPVFHHRLQIHGDRLVQATEAGIPTGALLRVAGTAFDFREPRPVGDCDTMPRIGGICGYNHSWLVDGGDAGALVPAARLTEPVSGRSLEILTTEPSVHVYVANHFSGEDIGAAGVPLRPHHGIALETQHLPDSPNQPHFPTTVLRPGETFRSTTIYRFSVEGEAGERG